MTNTNKHEVIVSIEKKDWDMALEKAFNKKSKDVKIDGFRQGKVPKDVFEKKYGKETLYMDAVDNILPIAYKKALEESKLVPVVQPNVDIKTINDDGVELVFSIITKPDVKISKYKGLKVAKPDSKVSPDEVKAEIEKLRKQYSEIIVKDGQIVNGDIAVINFEGFKDGIPFEGGKGENYSLEIGSNTFIPGFEEQLLDMKKNDEKEIEVTFPEEYPSEDLKGKKVIFKVQVNEIKGKQVPELNEDFFQDLGMEGVNDEKTLEKEITEKIRLTKEAENENIYIDSILETVSKNVTVDIPEELVIEEVDRMIGRYAEQLKMQGLDIKQYYQFSNTTEADLKKQMTEEAKKHVTYRLMLEEIASIENINITEEEAMSEATRLADNYKMDKNEFLKLFGGLEMVKYDLQMRKTMEMLKENN